MYPAFVGRFKSEYEVHIDALNVALSGAWVKQIEDRENIKFSRPKSIDQGDLQEMEKKCRSVVGAGTRKWWMSFRSLITWIRRAR